MTLSNKTFFWLAMGFSAGAALSFWWWTRLMAPQLAACVKLGNDAVAAGLDCRHVAPLNIALVLAACSVLLLCVLAVRKVRAAWRRSRVAVPNTSA